MKINSLKDEKGNIINNPESMVELFNASFCKSFIIDNNVIPNITHQSVPSCFLSSILFSPSAVLAQLNRFKSSNSISPDGLSANLLRTFGHALAAPLEYLFEFFFSRNLYTPLLKNF